MTEPNATRAAGWQSAAPGAMPPFPPGRYGRRRERRRRRPWLMVLLAALMVAASAGIAYRLYKQYGDPPYRAVILSETERTADRVTIRFEVRSRSGGEPAICRVRARAIDGLVVGAADVPVPAGKRVEQTYTLATSQRAVVVDIPRCRPASTPR